MPRESIHRVGASKATLVSSRRTTAFQQGIMPRHWSLSPENAITADVEAITKYFLEFWQPFSVVKALDILHHLELKRNLEPLYDKLGNWCPPPELAKALKKPPPVPSCLPDTKELRNLKFVISMMGCNIHENRPYKEFLKAKSIRQKRLWMHRYMPRQYKEIEDYCEPLCPTRIKRLHHFFPNRFREHDGCIHFNHKPVSFDKSKNIYYIGKTSAYD